MTTEEAFKSGEAAEEAGDFVAAAAAFTSLLNAADVRVAAEARLQLGRVTWKQGRIDEALTLCDEARDLAMQLGDPDLRARVENAIGVLHVARGEYAQATAAYGIALDLTSDVTTRAKIALNLGVIGNIQGAFDSARRHYAQSLALYKEAQDDRGQALALHNLGMLHADRAEWDEAEESFQRALALFEEHGNRQMIANVMMNRSEVSYGRGRMHEGIAQCDMALRIYGEIGDELGRGEALRWMGRGLLLSRRIELADTTLAEALRIAERMRSPLLEAEAARELARVRLAKGVVLEGRSLLERSLSLFSSLGARREQDEVTRELHDLEAHRHT